MNHNSPTPILSRRLPLFLVIFILTGSTISGLMMMYYRAEINTHLSQLKTQEKFSVALQGKAIDNLFDSIIGDLFFLSQQNEILDYFEEGGTNNLNKIAREYFNLSTNKKIYDQIRFLDEKGMEIVRIDFDQGRPSRITSDKLQSKGKRYYFRDCYDLDQGEVFISPFDLNIEHGQIEKPLKPMIRIGTPIFDRKGMKRGIVLLNYLGSDLITKIIASEQLSAGSSMLLNKDGYWLHSPDPNQNWGFMFEDHERSFSYLFPDIWQLIQKHKNGQVLMPEGLYTFQTIYPIKKGMVSSSGSVKAFGRSQDKVDSQEYHWHLVSFVSKDIIKKFSRILLVKLFSFGAGLFVIVASGSWFFAYALTKMRIHQNQLKALALYDPLTQLPNRRLLYDRLEMIMQQSIRNKYIFGLLYIDLDGFKKINDSLGHEAGDALLCKVAHLLRQCVRKSDTVARLGGDEFAIIACPLDNDDEVQIIAGKVIDTLSEPITISQGKVQIGASIGISLFPSSSEEGKELVRQADQAMYSSKKRGKNCSSIFSTSLEVKKG